ncbi:MAG TPA: hypothetical protein VGN34_31565, partial [Ktedonobacteraceae bacterium]
VYTISESLSSPYAGKTGIVLPAYPATTAYYVTWCPYIRLLTTHAIHYHRSGDVVACLLACS